MRLYNLLRLLLLSAVMVHVVADCAGSECFDIVFVIDGTGITHNVEDDFKQTLLFMSNVTNMFIIGSSNTLFGLYIIGRDVGQRMVIPLPSFNTTASLREKLRQITFQGKDTTDVNMHTALSTIQTTYMNEQNGLRRKSATCVVVLLVRGLDPRVVQLNTAATLIKREGVNIYAIKISNYPSSQLQAIVSAQDFLFDGTNMNQLETFIKPLVESVKQQEKCKRVNITVSNDIYKNGSCLNSRLFCKIWTDRNINRVLSLSNLGTSTRITDYIELKQLGTAHFLCFRKDIRNVIQKFTGIIRADNRSSDRIAVTVNIIIRPCSEDGDFQNPRNNCTRKDIAKTAETIIGIINEIIGGSKKPVNVRKLNEALDNMLNKTMPQETSLQEGDIKNVKYVLDKIANQTVYTKIKTDVNFSTLLGIADNLIDTNNINTWSSLIQNKTNIENPCFQNVNIQNGSVIHALLLWSSLIQNEDTGAETIVGTVDTLVNSMVSLFNVTSDHELLTYSKRNLVVTITPTSTCQDAITIDDKSYYNLRLECENVFSISVNVFNHVTRNDHVAQILKNGGGLKCLENVEKALSFSSVAYQSLSNLVTTKRIDDGNISAPQSLSSHTTFTVNTAVISLSLSTKRKTKLATPVVLTFKPIKPSRTDAVCVSMDTYKIGVKYWTSSGCKTSRSSTGHVVCECDHLSNFAVLMSTYGTPAEHAFALMLISHVGGILSIICSALTVVIYVVLWLRKHRPIQNQRSTVLINLCCAIGITYTLFLSGISKTSNKDGCTAIAVVLHYMFLVVIFALFGEGVMLAGMVIFPLKKWRTGRYTIPLSSSFPLVIIGISMGATKLSGYGDNIACWLSRDTGLIWAFLAPVVFIIVINIGIMVMVFRAIFQTRVFKKKSEKQKAKTGLRNLCILVPVMGVTWILGVFAVDERTVVFQYLFTIFNSLQGVFIFMMHCVFNKQVREAFKKEKGKLLSKLASSKQETQMKTLKSTTTSNDNTTNSETDALKGEDNKNTTPYRNQAIHLK